MAPHSKAESAILSVPACDDRLVRLTGDRETARALGDPDKVRSLSKLIDRHLDLRLYLMSEKTGKKAA